MTEAENRIVNINSKHGEYAIELKGNIIRVDGKGVINKSILEQYLEDVRTITSALQGQPWGFLGFVNGTGILTPEAEHALVVSIQVRKQFGMRACALVVTNADIPSLVKNQFERVYQRAQIDYRFCASEDEAYLWLGTQDCSTAFTE
ncbi:hypothetical protein [Alteromonas sp. P256]|jgi:hypothetical protein|uniref:hypothetical protein n=1 Tax=Alteromonas sp. P256 TaxID=3117399 RepID=UPI002FE14779